MRHLYPEINDPVTVRFVSYLRTQASKYYGQPVKKIDQLFIHSSEPIHPKPGIRRKFQLTSPSLTQSGTYVIFLSRAPAESGFEGQLAHEVFHLQNPSLQGPYIEGMCTVFAEEVYEETKNDWACWARWFKSGGDPYYAATYYMMKDISAIVGKENYRRLIKFTAPIDIVGLRLTTDVNGWLATLPDDVRASVKDVIEKHQDKVTSVMPKGQVFLLPAD